MCLCMCTYAYTCIYAHRYICFHYVCLHYVFMHVYCMYLRPVMCILFNSPMHTYTLDSLLCTYICIYVVAYTNNNMLINRTR